MRTSEEIENDLHEAQPGLVSVGWEDDEPILHFKDSARTGPWKIEEFKKGSKTRLLLEELKACCD